MTNVKLTLSQHFKNKIKVKHTFLMANFSLVYSYFPAAGKELRRLVGQLVRGMYSGTRESISTSCFHLPSRIFSHNVRETLLHTIQS